MADFYGNKSTLSPLLILSIASAGEENAERIRSCFTVSQPLFLFSLRTIQLARTFYLTAKFLNTGDSRCIHGEDLRHTDNVLYNIKAINANANYRGYPKSNHYPFIIIISTRLLPINLKSLSLRAVLLPLDLGDILVALGVESVLVAGVRSLGERLQLGALGHKADGCTALRNVALDLLVLVDGDASLLNDNELLASVVFQALVAGNKGLGQEIGVWVLGLVQLNTSSTRLKVKRGIVEVLVLGGDEANAVGSQGSATIANGGSLAVLTLLLGSVLVKDAAVLLADAEQGEAGSGVDAGELKVLNGRIKVQRGICNIDNKLEAL